MTEQPAASSQPIAAPAGSPRRRALRLRLAWWATVFLPAPLGFGFERFIALVFALSFLAQLAVAVARARARASGLRCVGWFFLYWLAAALLSAMVASLLLMTHLAHLTF